MWLDGQQLARRLIGMVMSLEPLLSLKTPGNFQNETKKVNFYEMQ